jgi:uncharacterized protein YgiM (DUF1202 family)
MRSIVIGLLVLLAAGSAAAQQEEAFFGTIYGTTNVRSGPDPRFEIVGQLQAGDRVLIDGRESEAARWLHIALTEDTYGWIPTFMIIPDDDVTALPILETLIEQGAGSIVMVAAYGRVNVRGAPGIDEEIVGQLDIGDEAAVVARSSAESDWLLIHFADGREGWVAHFTVTLTGDPTTLPILVPDSSGVGLVPPSLLIRALFNARLHTEPLLSAPVVITVPYNAQVTPIARTRRGDWLYVGYAEISGWGVARLFDMAANDVRALPVQTLPEATQTP